MAKTVICILAYACKQNWCIHHKKHIHSGAHNMCGVGYCTKINGYTCCVDFNGNDIMFKKKKRKASWALRRISGE